MKEWVQIFCYITCGTYVSSYNNNSTPHVFFLTDQDRSDQILGQGLLSHDTLIKPRLRPQLHLISWKRQTNRVRKRWLNMCKQGSKVCSTSCSSFNGFSFYLPRKSSKSERSKIDLPSPQFSYLFDV